MKKKGAVGFVVIIIGAVIAVLIGVNALFPFVQNVTDSIETTEGFEVHNAENQTYTLTEPELETGSLVIAGLTLTANYTVSYTTGIVTFVNRTTADNYTAVYNYFDANYLDNTNERNLYRLVILAFIIGLIVFMLSQFGVM